MDKQSLNERDICTKFIAPALRRAGWDEISQIREEVRFSSSCSGRRWSNDQASRGITGTAQPTIPIGHFESPSFRFRHFVNKSGLWQGSMN